MDILNGDADALREQWNQTEAAADFAPLPAGTYEAYVHSVELFRAGTGTPGVKVRFDVCAGEHAGRAVFHDLWLTPAAMPQTKRDCLKLGLDSLDKLESATVPPGRIRCKVRVALRRDDDGSQYNRVRRFDVLGVDEPQRDPFAPPEDIDGATDSAEADPPEASFDFGANADRQDADATPHGTAVAPQEGGES